MTTTTVTPASEKQLAFIEKLMGEKVEPMPEFFGLVRSQATTTRKASQAINVLMALPSKPTTHQDGAAITEGFYVLDGKVYRVQPSKTTSRLYGKVLEVLDNGHASWEYAPGAMRTLARAERLTLDQAKAMGHRYGVCMVCGKTLTNPASVEAGIGPICAGRL